MEDIIETLLGLEIMDESDNIADLQVFGTKELGEPSQTSWYYRQHLRHTKRRVIISNMEEAFIKTPLGVAKVAGDELGLSSISVLNTDEKTHRDCSRGLGRCRIPAQ